MKNRITPKLITELEPYQIFVFGSNQIGIHGAGAAKTARLKFGAIYGKAVGIQGQSYAIPTKDSDLKTLSLKSIQSYVTEFFHHALDNHNKTFLVTEIGCGLAGYKPSDIAPLFKRAEVLTNVHLPESFWEEIL